MNKQLELINLEIEKIKDEIQLLISISTIVGSLGIGVFIIYFTIHEYLFNILNVPSTMLYVVGFMMLLVFGCFMGIFIRMWLILRKKLNNLYKQKEKLIK